MAEFVFEKQISLEQLKEMLEDRLDPPCEITVIKNRLKILESGWKACSVVSKEDGDKTVFSGPVAFVPSFPLRLLLLLGLLGLASIITTMILGEFALVAGGIVPLIIFFILQKMIPQSLAQRVSDAMKEIQARTG